ncbi:MAG: SUMF1/EgtB/PvdO family nonheme iron enzyme, partial [Nannocystaceae bacterium]|nr:SUMF1/EgtB/PvdO family nonheme iron enzyme [Nannocystaceae bacterium]
QTSDTPRQPQRREEDSPPWEEPKLSTPSKFNLDGVRARCLAVSACPQGDSALGCRQMLGNVWEWTSDWFRPYPGFVADPYREYSLPWFDSHRTLRGGSLMTAGGLLRNTVRNYAVPTRRDLFAGFRTCAM